MAIPELSILANFDMKFFHQRELIYSTVKQGNFPKLTKTYYYDGPCSDSNVSLSIKTQAAAHYKGQTEGGFFKV